jgi:small conductance mechanosensitive channel
MDTQIATLNLWFDTAAAFLVTYSFQILGAIVFLLIGLKVAGWVARLVLRLGQRHAIDPTITAFAANVVRVVVLALVVVATLGNFGISIAPLIALIGAGAFGATVAIQGPLSNYGAGLSLVLGRPFAVGDAIKVKGVSGMVEEITLATTFLTGDAGERIMVPNKQIVGEILVNYRGSRLVESQVKVAAESDIRQVLRLVDEALARVPGIGRDPAPEIGIQAFGAADMTIAMRYWVPARAFFATQFAANLEARAAMAAAGVKVV